MRQRMNPPPLGDLLKGLGGQSEPFGMNAEDNCGRPGRRNPFLFFPCEMRGPLAAVAFWQWPIQQPNSSAGINRAIPAMNVFLQFGATPIPIKTNLQPASTDVAC